MAEKQKNTVLRKSRIAVGFIAALLFVLGLILVAQGFIDTNEYRAAFIEAVKAQTGRTPVIKGRINVALLPTPMLSIPDVELRDPASDQAAPAITVDMIKLHVPFLSVFSTHPRISGVVLEHPVLELARGQDKIIHWEWLNLGLMKSAASTPLSVEIDNGGILYQDNVTDSHIAVDNINVAAATGDRFSLSGGLSVFGHALKFSADTNAGTTPAPQGMTPLHIHVSSGKDTLVLHGGVDASGDVPKIKGALAMNVSDMLGWIKTHAPAQNPGKLSLGGPIGAVEDQTPLPLKISADWSQEGVNIALANLQLQGMNSTGAGKIDLAWQQWRPAFTVDMDFANVNCLQWKRLLRAAFIDNSGTASAQSYNVHGTPPANPLPQNLQLSLHVKAAQVAVGSEIWHKGELAADLGDGAATVNKFAIELPDGASLALFGIVSEGTTNGLRFEGSMETAGKSLRQTLTVFDDSAADLPETGFGDFYARSNIFISSEQMRLSDADVKLTDLHLTGGLVAYFDTRPRIEADVKLKDINFDYFRDVWREAQAKSGQQDFFLKFDRGMNFNWLKKLQTNIDFKVSIDRFTFLERKGDNASFRIYVKEGDFSVYDMRFNYPNDTVETSFDLDVRGERPTLSVIFNADKLDTRYFSVKPPTPEEIAADAGPPQEITAILADKNLWSSDLIDMSWMDGFNANFDISVGQLKYGKLLLDRLKFQAALVNNLLTFKNFSFAYWQGRCSILGAMYGGKVPGISVSFTLFAAELQDMMKALTGRENISGKVSVSGTLTTSGVNSLSWVSQADAKLVMAGRGVHVDGINMQGVIDAVSVSRTAADVFNNVNLELLKGSTDFSVDGAINILNGVMRTPGITLKTGAITGDLTGEVRLIPWNMDLSTFFQFPSITSETIPTLTVQLSGAVATPEMHTDTASLESYVAKRITSK